MATSSKYFFDHLIGSLDTSSMGFEGLPPDLAAYSTGIEVIKILHEDTTQVLGGRDTPTRIPYFENLYNLSNVLVVRPEEHRTSGMYWLHEVMPPHWHQCSAHECD